ncbi:hypothetical protein COR50_10435 [Chitinophaga caeni]|uniref:Uncharacterized protein n=2 Tax=Chitinophaga caeni TaxID=2029983 RepID=A0A291QUB0_9BACT|nr:hypothetical protein COR50_10435 [Chitinophaga caeni]
MYICSMQAFSVSIDYKGVSQQYYIEPKQLGYVIQLHVDIMDQHFHFEVDDEGNWRVIAADPAGAQQVPAGLLQSIADAIDLHLQKFNSW